MRKIFLSDVNFNVYTDHAWSLYRYKNNYTTLIFMVMILGEIDSELGRWIPELYHLKISEKIPKNFSATPIVFGSASIQENQKELDKTKTSSCA